MTIKMTVSTGLYVSCVLFVSVGYAVFLAWQEWSFRENLGSPVSFAMAVPQHPNLFLWTQRRSPRCSA